MNKRLLTQVGAGVAAAVAVAFTLTYAPSDGASVEGLTSAAAVVGESPVHRHADGSLHYHDVEGQPEGNVDPEAMSDTAQNGVGGQVDLATSDVSAALYPALGAGAVRGPAVRTEPEGLVATIAAANRTVALAWQFEPETGGKELVNNVPIGGLIVFDPANHAAYARDTVVYSAFSLETRSSEWVLAEGIQWYRPFNLSGDPEQRVPWLFGSYESYIGLPVGDLPGDANAVANMLLNSGTYGDVSVQVSGGDEPTEVVIQRVDGVVRGTIVYDEPLSIPEDRPLMSLTEEESAAYLEEHASLTELEAIFGLPEGSAEPVVDEG